MKKNGSALLTVVIIIGFTFLLATVILNRGLINSRINNNGVNKIQAFYNAEMGVMNKLNFLISSLNSGSYKVNHQNNYDVVIPLNNSFNTSAPYAADFQGDIVSSANYTSSSGSSIKGYKVSIHSNAEYKGVNCDLTETVIITTILTNSTNTYQYDSYRVVNKVVNYR